MQTRINISYPRYLIANEDGGILVFVAVSLAVLLGMVALSFDVGRMAATQSELQAYSDHVALAAAGELDGNPDAITRARSAAANMIVDSQTFGDGDKTLAGETDYTLVFLNNLPADDLADVSGFVTNDPAEAIYSYVTSVPQTVSLPFARALSALTGNPSISGEVGASAIAGFTQYACDITPLMFCLPNESYGEIPANVIGDAVLLRSGGKGAGWGPGDFGFLDPSKFKVDPDGPCAKLNGVQLDACIIAATNNITQCFSQRGVDIEPGQKVGIENAIFNTRFDMFNGIMSGKRNNSEYAPGPHVVKGKKPSGGGNCVGNNGVASNVLPFPWDDCFDSGTCSRFGNGTWTNGRGLYTAANHFSDTFIVPPGNPTRFEYYLAEIAAVGASSPILTGMNAGGVPVEESGRKICANSQNPNPERRVFIAAGIDCAANPINGAATDVPVKKYFKIFLLRPVGNSVTSPPVFDLWIEIVDVVGGDGGGGEGGVFHDVVQLYR